MEKYEIQKLRDLPIEGVAQQMGMVVKRHKALCPFHDDHHASLSFNTRRNSCRCYVCMGDSVGTIDLVMKYLGKDFLSACRWLAEVNGVYLEDSHPKVVSSSSPISLSSSSSETSSETSSEDSSETSSKASPKASLSSSFDAGKYARFFEHPWLNGAARRFLFDERRIDERVARWCRLTSWTDRKGVNWLQIPYFDMEGNLIGIQNRNLDYKKMPTEAKGLAADKSPQISQMTQMIQVSQMTQASQMTQMLLHTGWKVHIRRSRQLPASASLMVPDAASIIFLW